MDCTVSKRWGRPASRYLCQRVVRNLNFLGLPLDCHSVIQTSVWVTQVPLARRLSNRSLTWTNDLDESFWGRAGGGNNRDQRRGPSDPITVQKQQGQSALSLARHSRVSLTEDSSLKLEAEALKFHI